MEEIKMASFNKVILIGNLTSDPELKQSGSGISVCSFNIAVNRKYNKDGNNECDFITVVAWRSQAEFVCKYFKKGKPILVCGQLQTRSWTDKQGNKRISTEVVADEVSFVGNAESATDAKVNAYDPYLPGTTAPMPQGTQQQMPMAYGGTGAFEDVPTDESLPF
jgi:single-strand DNA-binding protein